MRGGEKEKMKLTIGRRILTGILAGIPIGLVLWLLASLTNYVLGGGVLPQYTPEAFFTTGLGAAVADQLVQDAHAKEKEGAK